MKILAFILILWVIISSALAKDDIYTNLSHKVCSVVSQDEETGNTRHLCEGVGGYKLAILDEDIRQSIDT